MNPIGANTWIWVSPLTDERLARIASRVRGFGFDVIELPIENLGDWDAARAGELLDELGLKATTAAVMSPDRDLVSNDHGVIESTQDYVRKATDMAARASARTLAGPLYSPVGKTWPMDPPERATAVRRLVENLRPLADYAGEQGVTLALEPLNRFETSFMNTAEQGDRGGRPSRLAGSRRITRHLSHEHRGARSGGGDPAV